MTGCRLILCVAVGALTFVAALAQDAASVCTPGVSITGLPLGPRLGRTAGSPFSATVKATFEQRLMDGNVITGEQVTHIAQNAAGWTRHEIGGVCSRDADEKPRLDLIVSVYKGKGETLNWIQSRAGNHIATYSHAVEPTPGQLAAKASGPKVPSPVVQADMARMRRESKTEKLGSAVIAGFEATGTRTTWTYPPGEQGNSIPLVVTTETWASRDGFWVKWVQDDPRKGKTTVELETVETGEPDPSLFAPPAGYTLKDAPYPNQATAVAVAISSR